MTAAGLEARAESVLAANWRDGSTVPSAGQYPHQWGWDAAYIAVGWSWIDERRAARELESVLGGQWADGRVPSIVFDPEVEEDAYFPGPGFWRSSAAPEGPADVATSGVTQPPLHGRAALEVASRMRDQDAVRRFLARVYPRLAAQHEYLARRRDVGGAGLAAIVHPWESGLDNSPAWDEPLEAVELPPKGVAPYQRRDLRHVDAAERPTDAAYDRFIHLARTYRDGGYSDAGLRDRVGFLVEDPLFNAIWLWSTHALAEIAERLGQDSGAHREAATGLREALVSRLWDGERFLPRDLHAGQLIDRRTVLSLGPLLAPDLPSPIASTVAAELGSEHFRTADGIGVASYDLLAPDFDRRRYWRGPVWANINWLLSRGLRGHGLTVEADRLDATTLELVDRGGLREYYDPLTGEGRGADDFSWTAAVVLDILRARAA